MADTVFADGMYIEWLGKKHENRPENAPDFVLGKFSFKAEAFMKTLWDNVNEKGYVNVDLKRAKSGKPYLAVDTWKPQQQQAPQQQRQPQYNPNTNYQQGQNEQPPQQQEPTPFDPANEIDF